MAKLDVDEDLVRKLAALLEETGLGELEYALGEERIRVARTPATPAPPPAAATVTAPKAEVAAPPRPAEQAAHPGAITAPMVGVVFLSPEPGSPYFIAVGDDVTEGQILLLIEAMKTFNPVRAPRAGRVVQILVDDASPVEYGEELVILE